MCLEIAHAKLSNPLPQTDDTLWLFGLCQSLTPINVRFLRDLLLNLIIVIRTACSVATPSPCVIIGLLIEMMLVFLIWRKAIYDWRWYALYSSLSDINWLNHDIGLCASAHTSTLSYFSLGRLHLAHNFVFCLETWHNTLPLEWFHSCLWSHTLLLQLNVMRIISLWWSTAEHMNRVSVPGGLRIDHLRKNVRWSGHLGPTLRAAPLAITLRSASLQSLVIDSVVLIALRNQRCLLLIPGAAGTALLFTLGVAKETSIRIGSLEYSLTHHS
jgi:hypothetical protein